jgi:outer membrane biosynthesis protein TonB
VRGHILIRTVWLGLFLLVCLAALASFKLAFSHPHPVEAAEEPKVLAPNQEMATAGTSVAPEALTKSDRLPIAFGKLATETKAINVNYTPDQPSLPAPTVPQIISRHWHDPSDQKAVQTHTKKPNPKESRQNRPTAEHKPTIEAILQNSGAR